MKFLQNLFFRLCLPAMQVDPLACTKHGRLDRAYLKDCLQFFLKDMSSPAILLRFIDATTCQHLGSLGFHEIGLTVLASRAAADPSRRAWTGPRRQRRVRGRAVRILHGHVRSRHVPFRDCNSKRNCHASSLAILQSFASIYSWCRRGCCSRLERFCS